ncbi:hypothetical protein BBK36DRAFT_1143141 [Trichoderma citrinoviride]|uniref:Uncharacterized protein n=1 Tax=Trichoderma citrinoviride TaxID=58853 RepID=A0A2T4B4P7_9HYPO|nr:hypothetical protein BBK36DRAFT_1143141 [Trichoderma citrinoviride]PTB64316.1 hypothetical protein BBK36DRAFT_1143141 [Trichoderma citrinoviride]
MARRGSVGGIGDLVDMGPYVGTGEAHTPLVDAGPLGASFAASTNQEEEEGRRYEETKEPRGSIEKPKRRWCDVGKNMIQHSVPSLRDVGPETRQEPSTRPGRSQTRENETPKSSASGTHFRAHSGTVQALLRHTTTPRKEAGNNHASTMLPIAMLDASTAWCKFAKAAASMAHVVVRDWPITILRPKSLTRHIRGPTTSSTGLGDGLPDKYPGSILILWQIHIPERYRFQYEALGFYVDSTSTVKSPKVTVNNAA